MPLTLTQLTENQASHSFDYAGGNVALVYRPGIITKKFYGELQAKLDLLVAQGKNQQTVDELAEAICRVVVHWDIMDGGVMFPLDPVRVANELPIPFLRTLWGEIGTASGEATGTPSPQPSPSTSTSDTPTGSEQ